MPAAPPASEGGPAGPTGPGSGIQKTQVSGRSLPGEKQQPESVLFTEVEH